MPSTFALALCLARRFVDSHKTPAPLMWVSLASATREHGRLYGPGLSRFGFDPGHLVIVEARTEQDALWAMEEGIKSEAVSIVAGVISELGDVPGRRLCLAAAGKAVPCLVLSSHDLPGTGAAETRWRVASAPVFDRVANDGPCLSLALERCRSGPLLTFSEATCSLAWCHETNRFHSSPPLADRAIEMGQRWSRAS